MCWWKYPLNFRSCLGAPSGGRIWCPTNIANAFSVIFCQPTLFCRSGQVRSLGGLTQTLDARRIVFGLWSVYNGVLAAQ